MQGTTMWRARLKSKDPCNETHILSGGKLLAVYYAIGTQGQLVWTVSASQAHLEEAGLSARHGPSQNQNSNCKENQSPAQHAQHAGLNEQEQAKGNEREDASAKEVKAGRLQLNLLSITSSTRHQTLASQRPKRRQC